MLLNLVWKFIPDLIAIHSDAALINTIEADFKNVCLEWLWFGGK